MRTEDTYVDIIRDFDLSDLEDFDVEILQQRDPSQDHVETVRFAMPYDHVETVPMPLVSAPYERVEIEADDGVPSPVEISDSYANAMPIGSAPFALPEGTPNTASAPYALIELGVAHAVDFEELGDLEIEVDDVWELGPRSLDLEQGAAERVAISNSYAGALPMPLYSVPFEKIDLDVIYPVAEPDDVFVPQKNWIPTVAILLTALASGFALAFLLL